MQTDQTKMQVFRMVVRILVLRVTGSFCDRVKLPTFALQAAAARLQATLPPSSPKSWFCLVKEQGPKGHPLHKGRSSATASRARSSCRASSCNVTRPARHSLPCRHANSSKRLNPTTRISSQA